MALADAVKPQTVKGPKCGLCAAIERLPDSEVDALNSMLADPEWTYPAISAALANEGYMIRRHTVGSHARGECARGEVYR